MAKSNIEKSAPFMIIALVLVAAIFIGSQQFAFGGTTTQMTYIDEGKYGSAYYITTIFPEVGEDESVTFTLVGKEAVIDEETKYIPKESFSLKFKSEPLKCIFTKGGIKFLGIAGQDETRSIAFDRRNIDVEVESKTYLDDGFGNKRVFDAAIVGRAGGIDLENGITIRSVGTQVGTFDCGSFETGAVSLAKRHKITETFDLFGAKIYNGVDVGDFEVPVNQDEYLGQIINFRVFCQDPIRSSWSQCQDAIRYFSSDKNMYATSWQKVSPLATNFKLVQDQSNVIVEIQDAGLAEIIVTAPADVFNGVFVKETRGQPSSLSCDNVEVNSGIITPHAVKIKNTGTGSTTYSITATVEGGSAIVGESKVTLSAGQSKIISTQLRLFTDLDEVDNEVTYKASSGDQFTGLVRSETSCTAKTYGEGNVQDVGCGNDFCEWWGGEDYLNCPVDCPRTVTCGKGAESNNEGTKCVCSDPRQDLLYDTNTGIGYCEEPLDLTLIIVGVIVFVVLAFGIMISTKKGGRRRR